jgi:hydrogenase/urease accessory protein HupE
MHSDGPFVYRNSRFLKASVLSGLLDPAEADDFLSAMINAGFYSPVRAISDIV